MQNNGCRGMRKERPKLLSKIRTVLLCFQLKQVYCEQWKYVQIKFPNFILVCFNNLTAKQVITSISVREFNLDEGNHMNINKYPSIDKEII